MGDCLIKYLTQRFAKQHDCPIFDGHGEIPESDSPSVVVVAPDKSSVYAVPRKHLQDGIPDDHDTLFEMAVQGEIDDE